MTTRPQRQSIIEEISVNLNWPKLVECIKVKLYFSDLHIVRSTGITEQKVHTWK
jgi:hypothetical protein